MFYGQGNNVYANGLAPAVIQSWPLIGQETRAKNSFSH